MIHPTATVESDCTVGDGTNIWGSASVSRGSRIGAGCTVGQNAHIEGAVIGDRCKIQTFAYLPPGTVLEDEVFIGPNATFTNHKEPTATREGEFTPQGTRVCKGANIGANATIGPGIVIGEGAFVQMGARVWKNVAPGSTVYGSPDMCGCAPGKHEETGE